jgi:hypothetical protein
VQCEKREQRALSPCAELDDATVVRHLERTEDANLHASPIGCQRAEAFSITVALPEMGAP